MAKPDYIALYQVYLDAFNARDLETIKNILAPECVAQYKTNVKNRSEMLETYEPHWARIKSPIEILKIKAIDDGVWVSLRSPDENMEADCEYHYNSEGKQIFHDILDVRKPEDTKEAEEAK
jgi:hypothetical protein